MANNTDILKDLIKEKCKPSKVLAIQNKRLVLEVSDNLQKTFEETLEENMARKVAVNMDNILNLCHAPITLGPRTRDYLSSASCVLIITVSIVSLCKLRHFQVMPVKVSYNQNLNFAVNGINFLLVSTIVALGSRGTNVVVQMLLGTLPVNYCTRQIDNALLSTRILCYEFVRKYSLHSEMVVYHLRTYGKLFGNLYDYQYNPSFIEQFLFENESTYLKPLDPLYANDSIDLGPDYKNLGGSILCFQSNKKIRNVASFLICVLPLPRIVKNSFVLALFLEKVLIIKNQKKDAKIR